MKSRRASVGSTTGSETSLGSTDAHSQAGNEDDELEVHHKGVRFRLEGKLFSVLYSQRSSIAYSSGKKSLKIVVLALVTDFVQLIVYPLHPQFAWSGYASDGVRVVNTFRLSSIAASHGYTTVVGVFWTIVAILLATVADFAFILYETLSNKNHNNNNNRWPLRMFRRLTTILFSLMFISMFDGLTAVLQCSYWTDSLVLTSFPTIGCWAFPNALYSTVSAVFSLLLILFAVLSALVNWDPNVLSPLLQSVSRPRVMMQLLLARGCFVAASIVITNNAALLALAYVVTSAYMVYITAKWLPYYNPLMNTIMCSMFCTVCWCSMCAFAISYTSSQQSDFVSLALCGGLLLAPLIAWCFTSSRQRQLRHKKWAVEVLGQFVTDRKFARPLDVEICARCVRLMLSEEKEEVREEWILRGSAIYKAGTDQFPKSGHVMLCYSNFCRHVLEDAQLELAFVERARHLELAFEERYEIYSREAILRLKVFVCEKLNDTSEPEDVR